MSLVLDNFAETMTSAIQSRTNVDGINKAVDVYHYDICIKVQGPFMKLPFLVIFLAYYYTRSPSLKP
jgi:hypothetical protein